jgi:hypothetical protein
VGTFNTGYSGVEVCFVMTPCLFSVIVNGSGLTANRAGKSCPGGITYPDVKPENFMSLFFQGGVKPRAAAKSNLLLKIMIASPLNKSLLLFLFFLLGINYPDISIFTILAFIVMGIINIENICLPT